MADKYNISKDIKMIDKIVERASPSTNDDHLVLAKLLQTKASLISMKIAVDTMDGLQKKMEEDI